MTSRRAFNRCADRTRSQPLTPAGSVRLCAGQCGRSGWRQGTCVLRRLGPVAVVLLLALAASGCGAGESGSGNAPRSGTEQTRNPRNDSEQIRDSFTKWGEALLSGSGPAVCNLTVQATRDAMARRIAEELTGELEPNATCEDALNAFGRVIRALASGDPQDFCSLPVVKKNAELADMDDCLAALKSDPGALHRGKTEYRKIEADLSGAGDRLLALQISGASAEARFTLLGRESPVQFARVGETWVVRDANLTDRNRGGVP